MRYRSIGICNKKVFIFSLARGENMKFPAIVKFIGNQDDYRLGCGFDKPYYCRDCKQKDICTNECKNYEFTFGKENHAYFLEYWQGNRNSLHVKNNSGEIVDFIPLEDFSIIGDVDNVLNYKDATVRCITRRYDNSLFDIKYGKEYKAIGISNRQFSEYEYLIMDESYECYFYPHSFFEIIEDTDGILDRQTGVYVYDSSIFKD